MKKSIWLFALFIFSQGVLADVFTLSSPDIKQGQKIVKKHVFNGFGCTGENISPALSWENAPKGTKSFAVTVYDPDAPTGSGWWHWVMFNIPADVNQLKSGAGNIDKGIAPKGSIQGRTDYAKTGFGGPCPPKGDNPHHYIFKVYALKIDKIPLDQNAPAAMVGYYIKSNAIADANLTAHYAR